MLPVRTVDCPKRRAVIHGAHRSGWSAERALAVTRVNLTHDYLFILSVASPDAIRPCPSSLRPKSESMRNGDNGEGNYEGPTEDLPLPQASSSTAKYCACPRHNERQEVLGHSPPFHVPSDSASCRYVALVVVLWRPALSSSSSSASVTAFR